MTTVSNLFNKKVGLGYLWKDGRYIKRHFLSPAMRVVLLNFQRTINNDQNTFFDEAAESEGVELPREDPAYYFNIKSIHAGITPDPNKFAIWITAKKKNTKKTNGKSEVYRVSIYVTIGSGDFDKQIQLISVFLEGINNLIDVIPHQELVYGWPANVAENKREAFQPVVSIGTEILNDPDVSVGAAKETKGPLCSISFDVTLSPKENLAQ